MAVKQGDPAPDFELFGEFDEEAGAFRPYRLSEAVAERPMILHFFPAPFTRVCQVQMTTVRDRSATYSDQGVGVWGITGHYPWLITQWSRVHHFGVPILADYEHTVSEAYVGTYPPEEMDGLRHTTKRAVVAVGRDGIIRYLWVTDDPEVGPSEEIVQAAIDAAKA